MDTAEAMVRRIRHPAPAIAAVAVAGHLAAAGRDRDGLALLRLFFKPLPKLFR
jgi:hypothetical protein